MTKVYHHAEFQCHLNNIRQNVNIEVFAKAEKAENKSIISPK